MDDEDAIPSSTGQNSEPSIDEEDEKEIRTSTGRNVVKVADLFNALNLELGHAAAATAVNVLLRLAGDQKGTHNTEPTETAAEAQ